VKTQCNTVRRGTVCETNEMFKSVAKIAHKFVELGAYTRMSYFLSK
jgi:hypothetical protein